MLTLALRLLRRELRGGELRLLFVSLLLAVAAVTAVSFFTGRVRGALLQEGNRLLGADLLLVADHPVPPEFAAEATRRGLRTAATKTFPSMVFADGRAQLADVKAVGPGYPLRGQLSIQGKNAQIPTSTVQGPQAGSVWLDERLMAALALQPGATLKLGQRSLRVEALLLNEPDRAVNFIGVAPRLLMALDDLPDTGLEQPGSRIAHRLLVAGESGAVAAYKRWLENRLGRGERIEDAATLRPETRSALDQAERYLGLSSLLTVVLAALAMALAARRYVARHLDACAVMRCLGLTQRRLLLLHGLQFLVLGLAAALFGGALGYLAHFALFFWLGGLLGIELPAAGGLPWLHGLGVALVLLFGFVLPPLLRLSRVPTLRVLRRELGPPAFGLLAGYGLGWLLLAALMLAVAGDLRLGLWVVGGFTVALGLFYAAVWLALQGLGRLSLPLGFAPRMALSSLRRHAGGVALQTVALALGLMALILLGVTRGELLAAWERKVPVDAPNRFVINLQPEQRADFSRWLAGQGIDSQAAPLSPMVRGRLLSIAGRPVGAASYPEDERAQRLVEREFNLSWASDLPAGNSLTAGQWFPPDAAGQGLASVEAGLAKTLGIGLGDELRFSIGGETVSARVSNLRKLEWDSMRVNFFVLMPPGVLDPAQASYITSFHLAPGRPAFAAALTERFPNLTLIDIGVLLEQLRTVMTQISQAVQFVFLFTLLAGLVVLQASLYGALDERRRTLAVMRALGATRRQLQQALLLELSLSGGLAGLIAAAGAAGIGHLLAEKVFQLSLPVGLGVFPLALAGGAALALLAGWLSVRRLLATAPWQALREA